MGAPILLKEGAQTALAISSLHTVRTPKELVLPRIAAAWAWLRRLPRVQVLGSSSVTLSGCALSGAKAATDRQPSATLLSITVMSLIIAAGTTSRSRGSSPPSTEPQR